MPTLFYQSRQPAVISFFYKHGVEFALATHEQRMHLLDFTEELVSIVLLRIQNSVQLADETLRLTFDERMDVVDMSRLR